MSYFKVGEPYYKIGDWVKLIYSEYNYNYNNKIWRIIEIKFSPGELPIVKLENVLHYCEAVETTIDNIRPVQYLKKQNNKIEIKTVNNPSLAEFKKIFPDHYNRLIREFLFDESLFNVFDDMTKRERDMVYVSYTDLRNNTLDECKLIAKINYEKFLERRFNIDILYDKTKTEENAMTHYGIDNWVKNPYTLYADLRNNDNLKNNLKHIIDMSYDKIREENKGERDMYYLACDIKTKNTVACYTNIKKVIFNDPATIIFWKDGSKTVVKCGPDEKYDPEKGMAMAIAKRVYGTSETGGNYYNIFKKWLPEEKTLKDVLEPMVNNDLVPTFISKEDTLDAIRSIAEGLSQLNKEANIDITDWTVK